MDLSPRDSDFVRLKGRPGHSGFKNLPGDSVGPRLRNSVGKGGKSLTVAFDSVETPPRNNCVHCESSLLCTTMEWMPTLGPEVSIGPRNQGAQAFERNLTFTEFNNLPTAVTKDPLVHLTMAPAFIYHEESGGGEIKTLKKKKIPKKTSCTCFYK